MSYSPRLFESTISFFHYITGGSSTESQFFDALLDNDHVIVSLLSSSSGAVLTNTYSGTLTETQKNKLTNKKITFVNNDPGYSKSIRFNISGLTMPVNQFRRPSNNVSVTLPPESTLNFIVLEDIFTAGAIGIGYLGMQSHV